MKGIGLFGLEVVYMGFGFMTHCNICLSRLEFGLIIAVMGGNGGDVYGRVGETVCKEL